jgi:hypothetical protein
MTATKNTILASVFSFIPILFSIKTTQCQGEKKHSTTAERQKEDMQQDLEVLFP